MFLFFYFDFLVHVLSRAFISYFLWLWEMALKEEPGLKGLRVFHGKKRNDSKQEIDLVN